MASRTGRQLVGDAALTAFLLLAGLGSLFFTTARMPPPHRITLLAVLLVVVAAGSAALRRWPVVSFGVAVTAVSLYLALGHPYGLVLLSVVVASFHLARHERLPVAGVAAVVGVALLWVHLFTSDLPFDGRWSALPAAAWIVVPFTVGLARRFAVEGARRQREAAERRVLDDERLRLASEVHDIVGHGLAAIQMQADIALHLRDRKPEQAEVALEAISRTSAEALAELRATLAAITPNETSPPREALAPTPGLDRLDDLCERMRASGLDVELTVLGDRAPLPPAVDVAAYRVLQESLTNVAKHSSSRRARIRIAYGAGAVQLSVVNAADPASVADAGFGIAGMRRRVRDVGGSIDIGADAGEFRVIATFPLARD